MNSTNSNFHPEVRRGILQMPEVNIVIFSFLLNFVWEIWQTPFFAGMSDAPHWDAIKTCTRATAGDVAIMLVAFWGVAMGNRSRAWFLAPRRRDVAVFTLTGFVITVVFEWLATGPLGRWTYADTMPVVPLLGIGLLPTLQWLLLPPVVLWFMRRQLS